MKIDKEKAVFVFHTLHQAYLTKKYPYDLPEATPPQIRENIPHSIVWGSKEHACFLFVLCYWMRGGIDSHTATRSLTKMYDNSPEMFLPEKVYTFAKQMILPGMERRFTPHFLSLDFKATGLGFNAEQIADFLVDNWLKMNKFWASDPRNIFKGIFTYEEACSRIRRHAAKSGFKGFQEKMVSMLTYFYMHAGIIDPWHFPIPVDFHVLRMVFSNEIVVVEAQDANANGFYTDEVLKAVRDLSMWYCKEYAIDPITLCDAIWLYSKLLCNQHPGNISHVGKRQGRKTPVYAAKTWSKAQTRTFEKTCGICPLQNSCHWCVPSAEYYIRGRLVLRGKRDSPLQSQLFPLIL